MFTHLKLCLATTIHNFELVKMFIFVSFDTKYLQNKLKK